MGKDVIIACDFADKETALNFLDKFEGRKPFVKIGMELFYAEGPQIVREIKARGHKIFLDLKLHDIPNTVKKSMAVLSRLDVDMCNLHAAGTSRMMEAALEGLTRPDGTRPLLIAVTQLTSTDQEAMERDLLIKEPIDKVVMHYAETAKNAGLDGVVCSPLEAQKVHDICGEKFLTVTPGVRFADGDIGDQKRVMTPEQAKKIGSDYIVVGRPITAAPDPVAAYEGLTRPDGTRPLLIAVTQLTSTDQEAMERDLLIKEPIDKVVMHYAETAKNAGLDGVVCSPLEAQKVHDICGEKFLTVTPGVRFADGDIGDQKRVMTPEQAKKIGSDYIVVGRPITAAPDPVAAYERCIKEFVD